MPAVIAWFATQIGALLMQSAKTLTVTLVIIGVVFFSLWGFGLDIIFELFAMIFKFVAQMVQGSGLGAVDIDFMSYVRKLPPDVLNLASYLGLETGMKMIISAIITRVFLNAIPFVRI